MRLLIAMLIACFLVSTKTAAQVPSEVSSVLQLLSQQRAKQEAIFNTEMDKANRIAIADLTKYAKVELRKDNLANAITAWQAILEIDPKDDEARRELEKLKQALQGMPAKQLRDDKSMLGVEFTGSGYIQTAINYVGSIPVVVVEAIVVPKSIGQSQAVIGDFHSGGLGLELMTHDGVAKWAFSCRDGNDYKKVYSTKPVALNRRVHLTGVKNGNFITLYVDEEQQGDWVPITGFKASQFPFLIAADPDQNGQPERMFRGFIDAVRVLQSNTGLPRDFRPSETLQADRFSALMLELNEGNGTTAIDTSPNRRNCIIHGATWARVDP